ncbi:MAG: protein kinase [Myxococcales bacterium]|nr:protein kinase [Myxococcales bacterium]
MTDAADPTAIGPFLVLRKLGEGGMGVVYAGYDVALDRKVALKLIRRHLLSSGEIRARMLREAQAMARLSHPNVVQVYQVGQHDDEIYMAMEYVEGETLTAWLRREPRPWQLVLRTVLAAGRGLAAAHVAGLVHRDFKPDNVLVGADGRPCVLDFGLVDGEGAALSRPTELRSSRSSVGPASATDISRVSTLPPDASGIYGSVRLTQAGKALGTPAYMSPEQHFGAEVGPASDQFSFGINLYEALYGYRPFLGMTWAEVKAQVRRGEVPPPPKDSKVPRWVFRALARGLATDADARWPTLTHMLDALGRDPRRTLVRAAAVGAFALAAAVGSYAAVRAHHDSGARCRAGAGELAGAWDDARAAAVERAFHATGAVHADDTWQRVRGRLDRYAAGWTALHARACEAHDDGAESTRLFDLRTRCLAGRRDHLAALVEVLAAADRVTLGHAVQAAAALPSVDACGEPEARLATAAPPDDPGTAAHVEVWRARLAHVAALEAAGQPAHGLERLAEVKAAAIGLRHAPLAAEVALVEGKLLMAVARPDAAELALQQALRGGLVLGLDAVAAEAAAWRILVIGEQGRRELALAGEVVAEALAERAHDDRLTALLHTNLGAVFAAAGQSERARAHYRAAIDRLRRQTDADPRIAAVHHRLGDLARAVQRLDEARNAHAQAARLYAELLGEDHPRVADPLAGIADIDGLLGRDDAARDGYTRALALLEAAHGPEHLSLLHPLVGLAGVHARRGEHEAAARLLRRAVALGESLGATDAGYAEALEGLAGATELADPTAARTWMARAVNIAETDGSPELPALLVRAGQLAARTGDPARARGWLERCLSLTTGRIDQADAHASAALELARLLAPADPTRACALLTAARSALPEPRKSEAAALATTACTPAAPLDPAAPPVR